MCYNKSAMGTQKKKQVIGLVVLIVALVTLAFIMNWFVVQAQT